jgi:integrase
VVVSCEWPHRAFDAHTFGTRMIREGDIRRVQEWMGHADIQTTMTYLHYESRKEDVQLVARAFASPAIESIPAHLLRASNRGSSRFTP